MATKASSKSLVDRIRHLCPCPEAVEWLSGYTSAAKAWRECPRGDWMLWLIGRQIASPPWGDDRKPLLRCTLECALTVKHLWPEGQREKLSAACATLAAWCDGDAEADQAKQAKEDLYVDAAAAAAFPAAAAAYAADAAAYAANAAYADARNKVLQECAGIVRKHYPKPPKIGQQE